MSNIFKVGIGQLTGTTTVPQGRLAGSGDPKIQKPRIMSIGGCVTDVICNRLARLADTSHIWRITVPCLMSPAIEGRSYYRSDNPHVSERLNLELTKQTLKKLETGGFDLLVFDPTSDFNNEYYEKDGCIINDVASGRFGNDWHWPEGFLGDGWTHLDPCTHRYIDLYIHYLKELIEVSERIGVPIIILRRTLCTNRLDCHGLHSLGDPVSTEANWWIDLLWSKISGIKGLNVLELDGRYSITSFDAPWGENRFHPIDEFYDYAIFKLMYMMGLGDDLVSDVMVDVYKGRAIRRHAMHVERDNLVGERDGLRTTLAQMTSERDAVAGERDGLRDSLFHATSERDGVIGERDGLHASLSYVVSERDAVICERDAVIREREALIRERETLEETINRLTAERDASFHEREVFKNASEQLSAERDAQQMKLAEVSASNALGASSLNEILRLDDRGLIRAVFREFICREPLKVDMDRYLALLLKNRPRLVVVGAILRECGSEANVRDDASSSDAQIAIQAHHRWKSVPYSYLGYRVGWQRNRA
ncbi:hypothetical protein B0G62_101296 [Paraburkholderia eburnea]|uniref:Uncharacterized protein n=1 Tax=Paraburkholderia eburnea TaxID=1189126 RepID=A0A2S4MMC9_9BURK|nr:hypothetical protein [Paraburkholderia eburnea]POR55900.1 hypothetical protein B0G62_101296 [Paraburkholderia eburnea]PRZ27027.1 hypothetical protein BX588_101295 [Paraburkholderia eburnea]